MSDEKAPSIVAGAALAAGLSAAGALASYLAAGATLGFLFGALTFAMLIAVPISTARLDRRWMMSIVGSSAGAVAIVWLIALRDIGGAVQWASAVLVLTSFVLVLCGLARALVTIRIPPAIAGSIVIILAIGWLTWPIWLSNISERTAAALVVAHPLMALNSVAIRLGVWTQQPLMYRLTTLGQDVPYRLPGIWPSVVIDSVIALMLLSLPNRKTPAGDAPSDR